MSDLINLKSSGREASACWNRYFIWSLLCIFCLLYWVQAVHIGSSLLLQIDDVFTLWMVRTPSIVSALKLGADTAPPAFYSLIKLSCKVFGFTDIGLRAPAIIATFIFVLSIFCLLRKIVGDALAGAAAILPLFGSAATMEFFARPPSLMAAAFSLMCLVWHQDRSAKPKLWRSVMLGCLVACSISIHFYCVLFIPLLWMMEFAWSMEHRIVRIGHWIGITTGAFVLLLWLPVILPIYKATHASSRSAGFSAHPRLNDLLTYVNDLAFGSWQTVSVLLALLLLAGLYRWWTICSPHEQEASGNLSENNLGIVGFAALVLPLLTFAFAVAVTHVFNERYIYAASLGVSIGFVFVLRSLRWPKIMDAIVLLLVVIIFSGSVLRSFTRPIQKSLVWEYMIREAPGNDLVVLPDGGSFFNVQESIDRHVQARTAYVFLPDGLTDPDAEPARIARAWKTLKPALPVYNNAEFLAKHDSFYILTMGVPGEGFAPWAKANLNTQIVRADGLFTLIHVTRRDGETR